MDTTATRSSEIHLGLAWNWEYDQDFVQLLDRACLNAGLSCYLIGTHNLQQTFLEVQNNERRFSWFLDRASDNDDRFLQFNRLLQTKGTKFINAQHHYTRSIDKANIHGELLAHGLQLPLTIILPPYESEPNFDPRVIEPLSKPFVVKPAKGGGGFGVVVGATRPDDVIQTRARFRNQRFLVQQRIEPQIFGNRRAWFRVYNVCGNLIASWWDDATHRYAVVTPTDSTLVNVAELKRIVKIVAEISQLDFFSTEIAFDKDGRYVVVDYVNDPCDMRPQSKYFDGVPDTIMAMIVQGVVDHLKRQFTTPLSSNGNDEDARWWP
jgi:glutathione synthase/RimK-type ligase-like ATP-grasp enzyme